MSTHMKSIEVEQPIRTVYDQWTQFEEFPSFVDGVQSVTQLSDRTLHWTVDIAGVTREFDATITDQRPDKTISWITLDGLYQAGVVTFEPVGAERTQVTLHHRVARLRDRCVARGAPRGHLQQLVTPFR